MQDTVAIFGSIVGLVFGSANLTGSFKFSP